MDCKICGGQFEPRNNRQVLCGDETCSKEYLRRYRKQYWAEHREMKSAYDKQHYVEIREKKLAYNKKYHRDHERPQRPREKRQLANYKVSARRRGHEWALTDEQALELFTKPCHYCGDAGGGIDRLDSDKGYTSDNVVPCCSTCNYMKQTMCPDDFVNKAIQIAQRFLVIGAIQPLEVA